MAFTYIRVTRTYDLGTGVPAKGSVQFKPIDRMVNGPTVVSAPVTATLDPGGSIDITLAATTDPATRPIGVTYEVREQITGQTVVVYYVSVPHTASGGTVDLSTLSVISPADIGAFAIRAASDYDNTTPPTGGQAIVWNATSSKWKPSAVAGSGGVQTVNGEFPDGTGNLVLSASDVGAQPADAGLTGLAGLGDGYPKRASSTWAAQTATQLATDLGVQNTTPITLTASSGVITPNATSGWLFRHTATANVTLANPTGGGDGQLVVVEVFASGADRVVTLPAGTSPATVTVTSGTWHPFEQRNHSGTWQTIDYLSATSGNIPADGSVTNIKVSSSAAISADKLADGTSNKIMTSAERTKLSGIATGANVGYATMQDEGSSLTARQTVNFIGAGVTVTDDSGSSRTNVSIPGGGSSSNSVSGVFNVKTDYGATGNGVTDDRAAIQNAINACQTAGGGTVYFPSGYYKVGSGLTVTASNVLLRGAGRGNTKVEKTGAFTMLQFAGTTGAGHISNSGVRDMTLLGGDNTGTLLDLIYGTRLYCQDLHLFGNPDIGIDTVEVWDSRFTNVYVEWCGGNTTPAVYVRSARTTTGTGSSTDSTNQLVFVGCLVETWKGGGIKVAGGGNSGYIHSIHFYGTKIETHLVRDSAITIATDAVNVSFVDTYVYMDAFDTGYSTAVPAISTAGNGSIRFDSCFIANGSAVLTTGISATGNGTTLNNIEGNYDLGAPTSGNHIDITASGFSVSHIRASNATNLVNGASTSVQAAPSMPIRAVAGVVSNTSFAGSPPVGTLAVDTTNSKLYVKTAAGTWKSVTIA